MNINTAVYASLSLSALSLIAVLGGLWQLRSLNKLRQIFFAGGQGRDLEQVVETLVDSLKALSQQQNNLEQGFLQLRHNTGLSVQKVGLVRFNPFSDGGGNFSFSLALLDGQNSGVVITSMHGREQNRIYTKKILKGASEVQLTEEEKESVVSAITTHDKQTFK